MFFTGQVDTIQTLRNLSLDSHHGAETFLEGGDIVH